MNVPDNLQFEAALWREGVRSIAGIDEAGRGPLAGPVVAAAVVFPQNLHIDGVTDSKKVPETRREVLFGMITRSALAWGVGVVAAAEIDRLNIRQATLQAMRSAVHALQPAPHHLLVDGRELPGYDIPGTAIVNGDNLSFTIAAASIIAKVTRDRMMAELHATYPQYGFDRHKGYATAAHRAAILACGPCPEHRRSFLGNILRSI